MVDLAYSPAGHVIFFAFSQESVLRLLLDVLALKNPNAHGSHLGSEAAEPTVLV